LSEESQKRVESPLYAADPKKKVDAFLDLSDVPPPTTV